MFEQNINDFWHSSKTVFILFQISIKEMGKPSSDYRLFMSSYKLDFAKGKVTNFHVSKFLDDTKSETNKTWF